MKLAIDVVGSKVVFLDVLGSRFRIRCDDELLSSRIRAVLAPFERHRDEDEPNGVVFSIVGRADDGPYRQLRRGSKTIAGGTGPRVLDRLITEVNRLALERCPHFAVHAGVVALGRRAIAFPAPSGGGKSTLTAACVRAGFGYVSDEALCLRRSRPSIVAYPKPFALSPASLERLGVDVAEDGGGRAPLTAADLGGSNAPGGLELSDLVLSERGASKLELIPLPRSEVVAGLLRFAFNHYEDAERSFRLAVQVARSCRAWSLRYDDPVGAAAALRAELSR